MGKLGLEEFEDPRAALFKRVEAEVHGLVAARDPSLAEGGPLPSVEKSRQLKQGDVTMQVSVAARRTPPPPPPGRPSGRSVRRLTRGFLPSWVRSASSPGCAPSRRSTPPSTRQSWRST